MPRLSCHFPITVSVVGAPSAAGIEELGRVVEQALAERLRLARRHLETVTAREPAAMSEARETEDPTRVGVTGRVYRVPSYEGGGALKPVRLTTDAPQPRDPAVLSDTELDAEYLHARNWLLGHGPAEPAHAEIKAYAEALEAELLRRAGGAAAGPVARRPGPTVTVTGGRPPGRPPVAPPGVLGGGPAPPKDRQYRVTASGAGGTYGEHDLPHLLGERGVHAVITSSGPGAHRPNEPGFDFVGIQRGTRTIWLVDNKALNALKDIDGETATALGVNLRASLERAIDKIRPIAEFDGKADLLHRLEAARDAVRAGKPIPAELNMKLAVTNAGGYATGARNLPTQAEFVDLVGAQARAARAADIAAAKEVGDDPTRPRSHADTERMRRQVGGVLSRRPVRVRLGVRIASSLKSAGRGLATIGAVVIWNAAMSRVDQAIEDRFLDRWAKPKLAALEPEIQARLDDRLEELVDLQLRHPGKPLYAVIGLLTTLERGGEDDTELESADLRLTSVSVAAERVEHSEVEHVRTHPWHGIREVRDLIRTTYSVELDPLGKAELATVLSAEIAAEEEAAGARSATPEQQRASQRRRDQLAAQLKQVEQAP
ncbi:hypothetical protein [Streptomyces endophytica]|uniref:Uncharacterized protein n=1 Tax=Streptomyces endophytica TaxID=2991496 RepID=A0ABY6PGY4_9ACTN|nr:hypothetical protein [Streptomyces endophytica]UZJ33149.1 hypothetical protein OJ254_26290 [Streptomyces endophytica]